MSTALVLAAAAFVLLRLDMSVREDRGPFTRLAWACLLTAATIACLITAATTLVGRSLA